MFLIPYRETWRKLGYLHGTSYVYNVDPYIVRSYGKNSIETINEEKNGEDEDNGAKGQLRKMSSESKFFVPDETTEKNISLDKTISCLCGISYRACFRNTCYYTDLHNKNEINQRGFFTTQTKISNQSQTRKT